MAQDGGALTTRSAKKRKTLSVGVYPTVSLSDARRKVAEAKSAVANGIDPSDVRKAEKAIHHRSIENQKRIDQGLAALDSFEQVAMEWFEKFMVNKTDNYKSRVLTPVEI